jgi:hypothetical protein
MQQKVCTAGDVDYIFMVAESEIAAYDVVARYPTPAAKPHKRTPTYNP